MACWTLTYFILFLTVYKNSDLSKSCMLCQDLLWYVISAPYVRWLCRECLLSHCWAQKMTSPRNLAFAFPPALNLTLFYRSVLRCWLAASKQAPHLMKISLAKWQSCRLEIGSFFSKITSQFVQIMPFCHISSSNNSMNNNIMVKTYFFEKCEPSDFVRTHCTPHKNFKIMLRNIKNFTELFEKPLSVILTLSYIM
jgi:hypothetical protein